MTTIDYMLHPFSNINEYLSAMFIINRFNNVIDSKMDTILSCIHYFTGQRLNEQELRLFIDKLSVHKRLNPTQFINKIESLNREIIQYCDDLKKPSIAISTTKSTCESCFKKLEINKFRVYESSLFLSLEPIGNFLLF